MKNDANSSLQFLPVPFGVFQTLKSSAGWVYLKKRRGYNENTGRKYLKECDSIDALPPPILVTGRR